MGYSRNLRRRDAQLLLLDRGGGTPTPSGAALLAEAAFMLDPRTLASAFGGSYAYDASVTGNWVDSASSAAVPAGKTSTGAFPVLKQDIFGAGRPGLRTDGTCFFNIGRAVAFINALSKPAGSTGDGYTVICEVNSGAGNTGNFRTLYSPDANNSGFAMRCGNATFGIGDQNTQLPGRPKTGYQLVMVRVERMTSGGMWAHTFRDLCATSASNTAVHATLDYLYGRGQSADGGSSGFIGDLGRMWVIPRAFTTTEWVVVQKYLRDQAGVAYPWAGAPVHAVIGDSNTANGAQFSWWQQVMGSLSVPFDNRCNLAISGLAVDDILTIAPRDILGLPAALGQPFMCSYSMYGNNPSPTQAVTCLTGLRASAPTGLLVNTPCDYDDSINPEAARNTWIAAVDGSGLADLRTRENDDVRIGIDGANQSPLTVYFTDVRHLTYVSAAHLGMDARAECNVPYYKRWLHDILGTADVSAPTFATANAITGTAQVAQTLTTSFGTSVDGGIVTQIEWLRAGGAGPVAVQPKLWEYAPVAGDVTFNLTSRVTRKGPAGTVSNTSAAVGPVIA